MRRLLGLILLLLQNVSGFEYPLTPVRVTSDVYCFVGAAEVMNTFNNGNIVNSCYIDAGEGYIVIDTGPSHAYAESAFRTMQRIKPLPAALVINTHVHDDHWLGNNFFTQMGVKVLGSDDFSVNAETAEPTRMQTSISPEAYKGTVPTLPTEMIAAGTKRTVGNKELVINIASQKAHTGKDLYIYLPQSGVLFAADLVFNDRLPSVRGGDINGWLKALEEISALRPNHLIGGHGIRTDADSATMTRRYLTQLREEVRAAIDAGIGIEEAVNKITMDSFRGEGMYEIIHRANVEATYRILEWEE